MRCGRQKSGKVCWNSSLCPIVLAWPSTCKFTKHLYVNFLLPLWNPKPLPPISSLSWAEGGIWGEVLLILASPVADRCSEKSIHFTIVTYQEMGWARIWTRAYLIQVLIIKALAIKFIFRLRRKITNFHCWSACLYLRKQMKKSLAIELKCCNGFPIADN